MRNRPSLTPAIFIDRDGVVNRNRDDYVRSWGEFEFFPDSLQHLALLAELGLPVYIVTNQSCIGRGLVPQQVVEDVNSKMVRIIREHGGRVDDIALCPHAPEDQCECRKPRPGLLLQLAQKHRIDLTRSFFIGDALSDAQAALAAGVTPILLAPGNGRKGFDRQTVSALPGKVEIVPDLPAAIAIIQSRIVGSANRKEQRR